MDISIKVKLRYSAANSLLSVINDEENISLNKLLCDMSKKELNEAFLNYLNEMNVNSCLFQNPEQLINIMTGESVDVVLEKYPLLIRLSEIHHSIRVNEINDFFNKINSGWLSNFKEVLNEKSDKDKETEVFIEDLEEHMNFVFEDEYLDRRLIHEIVRNNVEVRKDMIDTKYGLFLKSLLKIEGVNKDIVNKNKDNKNKINFHR